MLLKRASKTAVSSLCIVTFILSQLFTSLFAQNSNKDSLLVNSFKDYTQLPRELVYVHLNKSVYIKGEMLAFQAYVFNKKDKKLAQSTTNLYCSISDENGETIKSDLVLVNEGVANGSFFVDSLFTSGNYVFKAYTNWMKNFDEQNFYTQSIKVIDPEIESNVISKVISSKLDAQFLPEGGHLLANAQNTVGVIIKDKRGFGVPNLDCQLISKDNEAINFKTNQFGICKFSFVPHGTKQYKVSTVFEGAKQTFILDSAELSGITMALSDLHNKVVMQISTNKSTLRIIRNRPYKLTIHNGSEMKSSGFRFTDDSEITKYINYDDLFSGINIFTVFNENNIPILERLFFKYEGITTISSEDVSYKKLTDSIEVSIPFTNVDVNLLNHFSISVLPEATKSYNHNQNIISSVYLQPYVKGFIEKASYYFTNINRRKKHELDNLLLTQGWSSYNWNRIFYFPPKKVFEFERGISLKAIDNYSKSLRFVMFPTAFNNLEIFETSKENNRFEKDGLFPVNDEKITFSEIDAKNQVEKSRLYLQFYPSKIPDIEKYTKVLPLKESVVYDSDLLQPLLSNSWTEYEQLDEVLIEVNKTQEKLEKLEKSTFGEVDVFDVSKRKMYFDFATYIVTRGYYVSRLNGDFTITKFGGLNRNRSPVIYIDNRLVLDNNELSFYFMDSVDYVIIDDLGYSDPFGRGAGGVIKIVTDQTLAYRNNPEMATFQEIDIPLTFAAPKRFYVPKYYSYSNSFYEEYGVINWHPDMSVDTNGKIMLKIKNQENFNIKLFIEGTANNGSFISETKTIQLK